MDCIVHKARSCFASEEPQRERACLCYCGIVLLAALLVACQPAAVETQAPSLTSPPPASPIPSSSHTPTPLPSYTPTPLPSHTPMSSPSPTRLLSVTVGPARDSVLNLPYTSTGDDAVGRIRGRLFFPSQYIPPLAVYAVAIDGSRFYRVDTEEVPPGEPAYEIPEVAPGIYHVFGYPIESDDGFGGSYSYLAACEAGHLSAPPENCWEDPQYDLVPVEVRAGEAVEEINIFDWYGPPLPPPPDSTTG